MASVMITTIRGSIHQGHEAFSEHSSAPVNVKPQGRGAGHTSGICHLSLSRGWGIIKHLT